MKTVKFAGFRHNICQNCRLIESKNEDLLTISVLGHLLGNLLLARTEIPLQFIDGHRSPMGPIDGHQWSIDGHR